MSETRTQHQIAIVGSGPSGCYAAQFLIKTDENVCVTVFDRLPIPYGLIRYGVAADHQGTKALTRQFERVFQSPRVRFAGNVTLGTDLSVDDLLACFDAVILATGLYEDRQLEIPGAATAGVFGAGNVTRLLNGHPDEHDAVCDLGRDVVVIGAGNVALDVVRLLAKDATQFTGSDMDEPVHSRLTSGLRSITLVSRSSAANAKFDRAMLHELGEIEGLSVIVQGVDSNADDAKSQTARELAEADSSAARISLTLRFCTTPLEVVGTDRVEGLRVDGLLGEHTIPADAVITAIGFQGETDAPVDPRVRKVGWISRGPIGTIPDNRTDARHVADEVLALVHSTEAKAPGFDGLPPLVHVRATDFEHWRKIDTHEVANAAPGRTRRKLRSWTGLLQHPDDGSHPDVTAVAVRARSDEGQIQ